MFNHHLGTVDLAPFFALEVSALLNRDIDHVCKLVTYVHRDLANALQDCVQMLDLFCEDAHLRVCLSKLCALIEVSITLSGDDPTIAGDDLTLEV